MLETPRGNNQNGPGTNDPRYNGQHRPHLLPALRATRAALDAAGLSRARLTVPFYFGIMGASYPPSAGAFTPDTADVVRR